MKKTWSNRLVASTLCVDRQMRTAETRWSTLDRLHSRSMQPHLRASFVRFSSLPLVDHSSTWQLQSTRSSKTKMLQRWSVRVRVGQASLATFPASSLAEAEAQQERRNGRG